MNLSAVPKGSLASQFSRKRKLQVGGGAKRITAPSWEGGAKGQRAGAGNGGYRPLIKKRLLVL